MHLVWLYTLRQSLRDKENTIEWLLATAFQILLIRVVCLMIQVMHVVHQMPGEGQGMRMCQRLKKLIKLKVSRKKLKCLWDAFHFHLRSLRVIAYLATIFLMATYIAIAFTTIADLLPQLEAFSMQPNLVILLMSFEFLLVNYYPLFQLLIMIFPVPFYLMMICTSSEQVAENMLNEALNTALGVNTVNIRYGKGDQLDVNVEPLTFEDLYTLLSVRIEFGYTTLSLERCAICFEDLDNRTSNIVAMPCDMRHACHSECLLKWLQRSNTCPTCKCQISMSTLIEGRIKYDNEIQQFRLLQ
ncbi:hypothetical protein FGO68_gene305 [Halteria grandinella]|uniref:RING-type domain-containing protein n=1 Tax=Halteria grandinella TaxID=5974 RepID=A0A8J8NKN0_HALGN|nr:hypothetical protein FGO68_gene305 [Halteria grandinella]